MRGKFELRKILSIVCLLLLIGLLTGCSTCIAGCDAKDIKNTVKISNG